MPQIKREPINSNALYVTWQLNNRATVLLDPEDFASLQFYYYRIRKSAGCYYATRRVNQYGKQVEIKMHIEIAKPPPGYEVHHINLNSLDNRRENLQVLTPAAHRIAHGKAC